MKAIEAAWQKVMSARDMPRDDDPNYDRWLFEASIKEFCTALAQDDAAVARIKAALLSMPRTYELVPEDQWATEYARAAIRAMGGDHG